MDDHGRRRRGCGCGGRERGAARRLRLRRRARRLRHSPAELLPSTKGAKVIEGLLPLQVAAENAAMHKYLEDHWAYGDPVENLVFLLCLPEMKMYLDTARLIAKHTDDIADVIWRNIDTDRLVPASILLLAAQKQLRRDVNEGSVFELQERGAARRLRLRHAWWTSASTARRGRRAEP